MALLSKFGTISILSSDTNGTTKAESGFGFAPKVVLFFASGHASGSDGIEAADYRGSFGFATGPSARRCVNGFSDHGVATTLCRSSYSDVAVVVNSATAAIDGALDIQSFDSDGFTAVIDDQFPIDLRVHYLAIGGPDLIEAAIGSFQTPTAAGTQDITDVGFQPTCVIFAKAGRSVNVPPDNVQDSCWGFGVCDSALNQWALAVDGNTGVALGVTQTMRFLRSGECLAGFNAAATSLEAHTAIAAFLSNGFRLNWSEVGGTSTWNFYLAMRGGGFRAGVLQTLTNTTTSISVTDSGFEPSAALFASVGQAESAADTPTDHSLVTIGAAAGPSARGAILVRDTDNQGSSTACARAIEYDEVYISESGDAVDGLMDLTSFDADGMTLIMDDADPSQRAVGYLMLGPASVPLNPHEGTKPWSSIWRPGRV